MLNIPLQPLRSIYFYRDLPTLKSWGLKHLKLSEFDFNVLFLLRYTITFDNSESEIWLEKGVINEIQWHLVEEGIALPLLDTSTITQISLFNNYY